MLLKLQVSKNVVVRFNKDVPTQQLIYAASRQDLSFSSKISQAQKLTPSTHIGINPEVTEVDEVASDGAAGNDRPMHTGFITKLYFEILGETLLISGKCSRYFGRGVAQTVKSSDPGSVWRRN